MGKVNQEPAVAFAEVPRFVRASCPQHSSPAFDGRFMVYCQGLKIEHEKAHHPIKRTLENSCF